MFKGKVELERWRKEKRLWEGRHIAKEVDKSP